jgi:hypothetical protein
VQSKPISGPITRHSTNNRRDVRWPVSEREKIERETNNRRCEEENRSKKLEKEIHEVNVPGKTVQG